MSSLPINEILPELRAALTTHSAAVLQAPPGAGKTTGVPLALLDEPWLRGRSILILEPRRLAARAAAVRMAQLHGDNVGETIGYRIRFESKVSSRTRIEVLTEGILTRRLQTDSTLEGVGLVIFDEFHERHLHADLALALCLDSQQALREDLKILVMSATLDGAAVAKLLNHAPVVTSRGRSYPVDIRYLARDSDAPLPSTTAETALQALESQAGDVLVFLPGAREIRRTQELLTARLGARADVFPLYGDLPWEAQDRALRPSTDRQKIILATPIAETSLTIEGVCAVVDSGYARVPQFDPKSGLTRLGTLRISRASSEQRAGRAGRMAPGVCYRLWSETTQRGLVPHSTPEIRAVDLAPLALELAAWGVRDARTLSWLDPPPEAAFNQARDLLVELDALDESGAITEAGRAMVRLPLHPRLSHMLYAAQRMGLDVLACDIAALLSERDIFTGESRRSADFAQRIEALGALRQHGRKSAPKQYADPAACVRVNQASQQFQQLLASASSVQKKIPAHKPAEGRANLPSPARGRDRPTLPGRDLYPETGRSLPSSGPTGHLLPQAGEGKIVRPSAGFSVGVGERVNEGEEVGLLLALAYPDRVALARTPGDNRYLLASGRGARLHESEIGLRQPCVVAASLDAGETEGQIYLAAPLSIEKLREHMPSHIRDEDVVRWDSQQQVVVARREERFGALVLDSKPLTAADPEKLRSAMLEGTRRLGIEALPWSPEARDWQARVLSLRHWMPAEDWPDVTDAALQQTLDQWLGPYLDGITRREHLARLDLLTALKSHLDWERSQRLDAAAPTHITVPSGSHLRLEYRPSESPVLAVKLQEMFGLADTPRVARGTVPVTLQLLSPARRPIQVTQDLRGFWERTYAEVRKELKGKYPKHPWPDDPWNATPTARARRRGT